MNKGFRTGLLVGAGVCVVVLGLAGVLHAQGKPHGTCCVATVDVGRLFNEYDRMKSAQDELKGLQDRLQRENDERKQKSDMLEATLEQMNRDDPTYVKKMSEVLEARISHKNWFDLQQANMTREVALVTDRIYRDIVAASTSIAENAGYEIVLYRDEYQAVSNPDDVDYRAKPHVPDLQVP
jgi:Skp family chaperone for outer membrane proteins